MTKRGGSCAVALRNVAMAERLTLQEAMMEYGDTEALIEDNGFATSELTGVDVKETLESELENVELTKDQKLAILTETVTKHPLNREILYKVLVFCQEERSLKVVEEEIATYPEFAMATQNQYHMVTTLVKNHGLRLIERDIDGNEISLHQNEELSEDEKSDLVSSLSYETTDVGRCFVEIHRPKARLVELLNLVPERYATYIELLEFVSQQSRSYTEIQQFLSGRPALETIKDGERKTMQPSVFVDKLERSGALVWDKGWRLTKEGEEFLADLKKNE